MEPAVERAPARTFEDLIVWQKSHALVLGVYRASAEFPRHELYGLTAQLRRAIVSVPANIAEGFRKRSRADKARFLNIAQGSLEESRYYLILAQDLGYIEAEALRTQLSEVSRLLDCYTRTVLESRF
jgi:four helix bundle protein